MEWAGMAVSVAGVIAGLAALAPSRFRRALAGLAVALLVVGLGFAAAIFWPRPAVNCAPSISGVPAESTAVFTYSYRVPCPPPAEHHFVAVTELLHQVKTKDGPNTGSLFFFKIDGVRDGMQAASGTVRPGVERNFFILSITPDELAALQAKGYHEQGKSATDTGYFNKENSQALSGGVMNYAVAGPVHHKGV